MSRFIIALALMLLVWPVAAQAASREQQREDIRHMEADILSQLYRTSPGAAKDIAHSAGYAVFSSADIAALFVSGGYGHGIAHENKTDRDTYMEMAAAGVGLGVGVKDFHAVFVFDNPRAYQDFVRTGLDLSGNLDLAAKQGASGGAVTGAVDILPGVRVYQMTDTGLLVQAMLQGTRYWRDGNLNDIDTYAAPSTTSLHSEQ